ncbi:LapA family protein [Streptomyces sp. C10-9-1]|uniref:lipopolysaccharide assembly protein LapA domain-containing protein n=1 Tax=Streptomyces sp. C10-9-1 TaxID=1859285 RepID=UPI002111F709|nr:LapA family protein [Streptomyces sp. C10-9-1]MCQ6552055.1 LapA family protein [Streptomyces sp. C10-9-1]
MTPASEKKPRGRSSGGTGRAKSLTPSRVTALVLVALAVVFIVENTRKVEIRLLVPVVTMPLYLALLGMFVIGGLCGALLIRGRGK